MAERDEIWCEGCDNAIKDGPSYAWMCLEVPRYGMGFVTKEKWDADPPYERCVKVNAFGNCRWFTEIREAPEES